MMISRRSILGLFAMSLAGCRKTPSRATTPSLPRIVVLSPAIAITMRELGLTSRIAGRHGYDMVLDLSLPVCGDQAGLDYEAISKIGPTHVITQYDSGDVPARLFSLGKTAGFEVINFRLLTLQSVRDSAADLAKRFGVESSSVDSAFARALARRGAGFSGSGRVLLLAETSPAGALGPGSFHHEILEKIGGTPALATGAPFVTMDAEDILKLRPDAIVMILPRDRSAAAKTQMDPQKLLGLVPGLSNLDIPAVSNRRVALIDDPLSQTPSTALIKFSDDLALILTNWQK